MRPRPERGPASAGGGPDSPHRAALQAVVRVMGMNLIIDALIIVQSSVLIQRVDFRTQALARFAAVVVSVPRVLRSPTKATACGRWSRGCS